MVTVQENPWHPSWSGQKPQRAESIIRILNLSRLQNMSYELHCQAFSDIIRTERSPEVWLDGERDISPNKGLAKEKGSELLTFMFSFKFHVTRRLDGYETSRDGALLRVLASHQCGQGFIPRLGDKCSWFSTLFCEVFSRVLQFSHLPKTNLRFDMN